MSVKTAGVVDKRAIFKVDDGSVWHIAADSEAGARSRWLSYLLEECGYAGETAVIEEFGEPSISRVTMEKAASINVTYDETERGKCRCCGSEIDVPKVRSLLHVFHEIRDGVLCNSEWP